MDNIISAALEEVCMRGASGIPLLELWPSLHPVVSSSGFELSDNVKKVIWCHLTSHLSLRFLISGSSVERKEVSQQPLEKLEKIGLSVVAEEHLRDSFMGLYDLKHSPHFEISQIQRRVLERLAMARSSGITQNDLAKEFNMKGTNFFYVVRNLECQQLIVRQSIMVRDKESKNVKKGPKGDQIVNTNLLRLSRFAKDVNLNPQQRIEITRSAWPEILDEFRDTEPCTFPLEGPEDCLKEDVHINDYMPAMKAICEKLEAAQNKVDVVSSIKSALGYRKTTGHRAWRSILYRLKDSGLVEEFQAKVKRKDVACLRLLKKFDPIYFQPKTMHRGNRTDSENLIKSGKRGQITDQLVEIPLDHLIYDMIDATGQKGITTLELSTRLGIALKKLHKRVFSICEKFGVVSESEIHDKAQVYRFWTNSSHRHDPCKNPSNNTNLLLDGNGLSAESGALVPYDCPVDSSSCYGPVSKVIKRDKKLDGQAHKLNIINIDAKFDETSSTPESHVTSSPSSQCFTASSMPLLQTKYACKSLTVFAAQREQRILEILKIEKFLLKVELHKWLEDIEKDKPVTMDRKTLDRSLRRLQAAGSCQCISVYMPSLTNFSGLRSAEAILHTSVKPSQELLRQIYERQRSFDIQSRRSAGSARLKPEHSVDVIPELKNVKKSPSHVDDMPMLKAMVANGFVLGKMVRAKLLHKFLWSYLSSPSSESALISSQKHGYNDLNSEDSDQLFSIDAAIKEMPLELFLQVVGSRLIIDNLERKCKQGLRLSELPVQERRCLLDMQATSRLSSIVDILHRLKLIQLVNKGAVQDVNMLSYALELRPYLEEPLPTVLPTSDINSSEDCYKLRHDFILSDKQAVDKYWETLEYCFAVTNSVYSRQCFPGSTVGEVFLRRSWASARVMTIEQRMKLFKRVTSCDLTKKISFSECVKISRELNLSLEQVLRVSYDKRQARLTEHNYLQSENRGQSENTKNIGVVSRKRRRLSTGAGERTSSDTDEHALHLASSLPSESGNVGLFQSCNAGEVSVTLALPQSHEEDAETAAFISQCAFDELKPTRKGRFYWTDSLDKQLIILYARERAMLGAKFFRVEWSSLLNLPAQPETCKRRLSWLKRKPNIRRAISRLYGLLGERYTRYLDNSRIMANRDSLDVNFEQSNKDIILYETVQNESASHINIGISNAQHYLWDNFEDSDIKLALDEVLKYKRLARMEDAKRVGCKLHLGWTNNSSIDHLNCSSHESEQHISSSCFGDNGDQRCAESTVITSSAAQNRSKSNKNSSHRNISKFRGRSKISQICESLPIASAIELLKLVFLSCSKSHRVQNSLARTLKKYHHGDIFAAFSYLREKNYLVIGHGTRPFVLSRKFFHNISSSPFPNDSGKRATNFSNWLQQQQNDLVHDGVSIAPDLQCGEIFHLSSLVLSGEISVSPSVPCPGFDEACEFQNSDSFSLLGAIGNLDASKSSKRKGVMPHSGGEVKKPKIQSKADCDRKDKGFPGIKILLKMESVLGADTFECLGYGKIHDHVSEADSTSVKDAYYNVAAPHDFGPLSSWDAMSRYFELLSSSSAIKNEASPSPTVFQFVHSIINQAGKHGVTMDEISGALQTKGKEVAEMFVDTLEAFRLAVKVNAFDSIRVVDASFTSKYFISVLGHEEVQNQGYDIVSCTRPQDLSSGASENAFPHQLDNMDSSHINTTVGHSGINNANGLDMSNKTSDTCTEGRIFGESTNLVEEPKIEKSFHMQNNDVINAIYPLAEMPGVLRPILPWINGDGNTNMNVYRGLTRRILGIIMQNPSILEEDIIAKMDVLNPQSCKRLMETMLLDNHISVRLVHQTSTVASPPSILQNLFPNLRKPALILRKHYFANPMSTRML